MFPDLRVTIRSDNVVRAVRWAPHLEICGPAATLLDARERAGVTIADLTLARDDADDEEAPVTHAVVEFLCGGDDAAHEAIADWAALVGMTRVWFPSEVRDVEPVPPGKVEVRCTGCRCRLVDGNTLFWEWVRRNGHFPTCCPLCGADLPQWKPVGRSSARRGQRLQLVSSAQEGVADLRMSDRRDGGRP